jgi:hypothetical protein
MISGRHTGEHLRAGRNEFSLWRSFTMRKYMLMGFLGLTFVAVAGIVHARGGLIPSHPTVGTSAPASTDEPSTCPLQWLKSFCCSGD